MQQTIPASQIVTVNPGVVSSGGNPLALNGVCISPNTLIPTGSVQPFGSALAVSNFFGPASAEFAFANNYFPGNDNSSKKPLTLFFAPFNVTNTNAWLQSGSFAGVLLTSLQAINGTLSVVIDGVSRGGVTVNLSAATSFTNAATIIQTALNASPATQATSSAATIAGTTLTVGGTVTGNFAPGQTLLGTGVTAGSIILAQLTGTNGGAGTYSLSQSSTVASPVAMTTQATPVVVSWNAVNSTFNVTSGASGLASTSAYATGTAAALLELTSATGAILSQGALADTPATAAANIVANTQNWGTFTTLVEPSLANKLAYAIWSNGQNNRYLYVEWDTDAQAIVANATEPFGVVTKTAAYNGCCAVYNSAALAAMLMGTIASINFNQPNGRITTAFKTQSGFTPTVTNAQIALNLLANGYSFYGAYATANQQFNFFYNGNMPGEWQWIDTYVNQIYMNAAFQLALMTLVTTVNAIAYAQAGYSLIRAAMQTVIQQMLTFGAIQKGVSLSALQAAELNQAAGGINISDTIQQTGYYLQILDPGSVARGQRATPTITFWYCDGGAIQQITLASIDIQ